MERDSGQSRVPDPPERITGIMGVIAIPYRNPVFGVRSTTYGFRPISGIICSMNS
jgi:hypothetical protein